MQQRTSIRRARRIGLLLAVVAATTVAPASAVVAGPAGAPRRLAVSVPTEAAELSPGSTGIIPIRIVNAGARPLTVRVTSQRVTFEDDGRVVVAGRDPAWENRVDFPAAPMLIPAEGYRDVRLGVRMPARISPDLYFIGFLVTPLPDRAGNLSYVNQIGSYVTIDVPGPRVRSLAADLALPGFAFTAKPVHGELRVRNTGHTAAEYWVESDTHATPGSSTPVEARGDRSLLPAARSRDSAVSAKPSFPVALVTVHIRVFYPGATDSTTREVDVTKRVLVVQPLAVVILLIVLLALALVFVRRRRRRRPERPSRRQAREASAGARVPRSRSERPARRRVRARANAMARLERSLSEARRAPLDAHRGGL